MWDLHDGRLLQNIRVPTAPGAPGKIYAVALSPDGQLIAAGGFTNFEGEPEQIYVFDRATGGLLRRIEGLPTRVKDLVFSADGQSFAATLGVPSRMWLELRVA